MRDLGISPVSVIDVGAALGDWSLACSKIFPNAKYVLVGPLSEYSRALKHAMENIKQAVYINQAAASSEGKTEMYVHKDLVGSSLKAEVETYNQQNTHKRKISELTLDSLIQKKYLDTPFLIKLDVQGAEIDVLDGAENMLKSTEVVVVEVSLFKGFVDGHEFQEVISYMKNRGFVLYDLYGLNYRPYDRAPSQIDVVFVPEQSPLRKFHGYATKEQRDMQDGRFQNKLKDRLNV